MGIVVWWTQCWTLCTMELAWLFYVVLVIQFMYWAQGSITILKKKTWTETQENKCTSARATNSNCSCTEEETRRRTTIAQTSNECAWDSIGLVWPRCYSPRSSCLVLFWFRRGCACHSTCGPNPHPPLLPHDMSGFPKIADWSQIDHSNATTLIQTSSESW